MISVVCVFNDEKVFNELLGASLKEQTVPYQLVALDNRGGRFKSAAQALNYGANQASGDYLMFVHQDVDLCFPNFLEQSEQILNNVSNLGVAGVAGAVRSKILSKLISNIKHGIPPQQVSLHKLIKPTQAQTVDECLMFVRKNVFTEIQFDELTCPHWHLYGVDLCLSLKRRGLDTYVLPLEIYHRSMPGGIKNFNQIIKNRGVLSKEYHFTLRGVIKKHGHDYKKIYTTCGIWHTSDNWLTVDRFTRLILDILSHFKRLILK